MYGPAIGLVNPYQSMGSALSAPPAGSDVPMQPGSSSPAPVPQSGILGMPLAFWFGAVILVLVLKWVSERENTSIRPAHFHVGGYNAVAVVACWVVVWAAVKILVSRYFPRSGAAAFVTWL